METMRGKEGVQPNAGMELTPEAIEDFLMYQRAQGRTAGTCETYRMELYQLYGMLPEKKCIGPGTLAGWQAALCAAGYAPRTVNARISAANSLVSYLGRRDLQFMPRLEPDPGQQPALTRAEYLRLLQAARQEGKERLYLAVKVLGSTGVPVQDLPFVTVEAAQAGCVRLKSGVYRIPGCLREELLAFAARAGIRTGPVFVMRNGNPMQRTNLSHDIRQLCRDACVPAEKGSPRCLKKLYQSTVEQIRANIAMLTEQAYERMLETEQISIGWEQDGR